MAHIERRGKFQYRVKLWRPDKKQRRGGRFESRTFETREAAEDWVAEVQNEIRAGLRDSRVEAEATTLAEALERYGREITPGKKSAGREMWQIGQMRARPIAGKALARIRGKDVAEYIRSRQEAGIGPNSVRLELALISHLYTVARSAWGMESLVNPVPLAKTARRKLPSGRDRRLRDDEEARLLAAAEAYGGEIVRIIPWSIETAMRRGEIAAMRWEHLDKKHRVLLIPEAKNGTPRKVPLSTRALAALKGLKKRKDDSRVWSMESESISQAFERARDRARVTYEQERGKRKAKPDARMLMDLRFHDLRHEATSRLFELGLNPVEVAAITGHKTLQMLKRYTHLRAEDLAKRLR